MRRASVRIVVAFALSALAVVSAAAFAQGIQRCEDSAGRVTYVNGACPQATRPVRDLAAERARSADDQQLAKERANKDAAALRQLEKHRAAEQAAAARQAQSAQAKADKVALACRKLDVKLRAARDNLASSTLAQRNDRQRQVQRAEEDFVRDCGPLPR